MRELEAFGYLCHEAGQRDGGKFTPQIWRVFDEPRPLADRTNHTNHDSTVDGKPLTVNHERQTVDGFPQPKKDQRKEKPTDEKTAKKTSGDSLELFEESHISAPALPKAQIIEAWNRLTTLPPITALNGSRERTVRARWQTLGTIEALEDLCRRIEASDFLAGRIVTDRARATGSVWTANFDWCMEPANFDKIREGRYDPRPTPNPNQAPNASQPQPSTTTQRIAAAFAANAADPRDNPFYNGG